MRLVLVLASVTWLSACTTPPPPKADLPKPKPVEAMESCPAQLCTIRPEIVNLKFEDQVAMLLACRIADAANYFKCSAKQAAEAKWIRDQ